MTELLVGYLQSGEEIYEQQFQSITLPQIQGRMLATHASFEKVDFSEGSFTLDCTDVTFRNCNFSFCKLNDSSLSRVNFENCSFTGADFCESFLRDCDFIGCKCDMVNLNTGKFVSTRFTDTRLVQGYLENCKFQRVELQRCNLQNSFFSGTALKGMDLTSCTLSGMQLRREDIKGAVMTTEQAMEFLWMLEIKIRI